MQLLSNRYVVPPDGFSYNHPETGHVTTARDYFSWIAKAKAHLRANSLDVPGDLEDRMQDQLCNRLPPEWCGRPAEGYVPKRLGFGAVKDWLIAHAKLAISGFNFVSQAEAERRAYICARCPMNVDTAGCGATCAKLGAFFTKELAQRSTPHDASLMACGVCGCLNSVQTHFPLSILEADDSAERQAAYPEFCWKQKQSQNYQFGNHEARKGELVPA